MKRTNEEFKAEIFSRSDKIIKRRKKIKRIVMCCVPLLLCSFIGIYVISMGAGIKGESNRDDGSFIADNNFSIYDDEEACGTPEAVPEASDKGENRGDGYGGIITTSSEAVAVMVQKVSAGESSYVKNENTAKRLNDLIQRAIDNSVPYEKSSAFEYSISIYFSDDSIITYSIADHIIRTKDGIYKIDNATYDSILQEINSIIS